MACSHMLYLTSKIIQELALVRPLWQAALQGIIEQVAVLALHQIELESSADLTLGNSATLVCCLIIVIDFSHHLAHMRANNNPETKCSPELLEALNVGLLVLKGGRVQSADSKVFKILDLPNGDQSALKTALQQATVEGHRLNLLPLLLHHLEPVAKATPRPVRHPTLRSCIATINQKPIDCIGRTGSRTLVVGEAVVEGCLGLVLAPRTQESCEQQEKLRAEYTKMLLVSFSHEFKTPLNGNETPWSPRRRIDYLAVPEGEPGKRKRSLPARRGHHQRQVARAAHQRLPRTAVPLIP
jgi:hypothetical protein